MMHASHQQDSLRVGGHQPCLFLFLAVGLGIVADRFLSLQAANWWLMAAGALTAWWVLWRLQRTRLALLCLLMAIGCTAGSWHHAYWHLYRHDHVSRSVDDLLRPVCLRAEVIREPRWVPAPPSNPLRTIPRGDSSRMDVRLLAVRNGQRWQAASGRASVTIDGHLLGVECGDRLLLFAQGDRVPGAGGPGEFDYRRQLRGQRELCRFSCRFPDCVQIQQPGSRWRPDRLLGRVRRAGVASLWRHVGREHAPLAAAMTLGYREQLDRAKLNTFVETGSVHLLAISGLHVGILAFGLLVLARVLALRQSTSLALVIGVIIGYAMLVELRPPVLRATAIIVCMCLARWSGRSALSFNSLAAAALIVLALNPSSLFRTGAQYSFLTVAVLCATSAWFVPREGRDPLQRLIAVSRPWYWRKGKQAAWHAYRLIGASAVIWLVAMPLTMHHYHICSPSAVLVYPLVALPVALAMLSGFGVLVLGQLMPPLADASGWLCGNSLAWIEQIVETAHEVPGAFFWIAGPSLLLVFCFYATLTIYAAVRRGRPAARWPMVIALAWVSCFSLGSALATRSAETQASMACTFLDVGHGTSVLVELPKGKRLLYDAGSLGEPSSAVRPIAAALWARGITHLDAVVISHADADHYNGLPSLLDKFSVGVVYVSPVMFESEAPALRALREAIERRGIALREVYAGDKLGRSDQLAIEVLHPPRRGVLGSDNANSIVLDIAFAGHRILLPGDLESPGIDDVMAEEPREYDLIMAPHHGSKGSQPQGFARWTQPRYVVISGGRGGDVSEAERAYRAVGARSLYTAREGSIRFELDREAVRPASWHQQPW